MVIDVGTSSDFGEDREEKPTKEIPAFMEELVELIRKKFEAQNLQIEDLKTNLNIIKQNEIEDLNRKLRELENKIDSLEKKIEERNTDIDDKILDSLKTV